MRKNLLKFVRVREFAPEAEFSNSSPSIILPNVICRYAIANDKLGKYGMSTPYQLSCNRNLNINGQNLLCFYLSLLKPEFTAQELSSCWILFLTFSFGYEGSYCDDCRDLDLCRDSALLAQEWRCAVPQCGQPYDQEVMENALLQIVRQRERLYHVQDLVCVRCNQVKAAHLSEQCACAGTYKCKEEATEFFSKMQIILNVATRQKFQLLQEFTSWILKDSWIAKLAI